jgi:DNA polymerase-3 subunit beta
MKFSILKEDVIEGIQKSVAVIPARTGAAYLRSIWIQAQNGKISIMATDASTEFTGTYPAQVETEGIVGLQGKKFSELMRKLGGGEISFSTEKDGDICVVRQGRKTFRLSTFDSEWFQPFHRFPEETPVNLSGEFLKNLIDKTAFCLLDEEDANEYNCLRLGKKGSETVEVCAMSGHQFALLQFENQDLNTLLSDNGLLIPKKAMLEMRKWTTFDDIEFSVSTKRIFLRSSDKREILSFPLKQHSYPDYNAFLQRFSGQFNSRLEVNADDFMDSLDRLSVFTTENSSATFLNFSPSEMIISCQGQDFGDAQEVLDVSYSGELSSIVFLNQVLMETISKFDSQALVFEFTGGKSPCKIRGLDKDEGYMVIAMPVEITTDTYYTEEPAGPEAQD